MITKVCKKCQAEKSVDLFPKNKSLIGGYGNACKACAYADQALWRKNNPDRVKANNERARNRECKPPEGVRQVCRTCHIEKDLSEFRLAKGMTLGVRKACKACDLADLSRRYYLKSPEERTKWAKGNPERAREIWTAYADRNREKRLQERKEWRLKNLEKDRAREKRYLKNNRPVVYAKNARRRAAETQAVPKWLTAIQKAQIQEFYEIASAREMQTGEKHHVDHIVPLRGNGVNGLHVPWNLQVITEFENCSKHNKLLEVRS